MNKKRVFLIVLDSLGAGEAPDAKAFGDLGANTIKSLYNTGKLEIPNLKKLGIGKIDGLDFLDDGKLHIGAVARMKEKSQGKDTTIGHWEIAGHISESPLPTFPEGFPEELIKDFEALVGRGVLCNKPYSGTAVIKDHGELHVNSGDLIVYTSADSVFQIAAHEEIVSPEELYEICRKARKLLCGRFGVGRVIARPFLGTAPDFYRTANRRDFSLEPPCVLLPEAVNNAGLDSIAIGKISDIFAGVGISEAHLTHSNEEGMSEAERFVEEEFEGLCFVNLVDFDTLWGHRRDALKYTEGLNVFDRWLGGFIEKMRNDDLLIITADHGCDPSFTASTDHTREYTPCIIYSKNIIPEELGTRDSFADIAATVAQYLNIVLECDGTPMPIKFKR
jgi:phosphopentomutase